MVDLAFAFWVLFWVNRFYRIVTTYYQKFFSDLDLSSRLFLYPHTPGKINFFPDTLLQRTPQGPAFPRNLLKFDLAKQSASTNIVHGEEAFHVTYLHFHFLKNLSSLNQSFCKSAIVKSMILLFTFEGAMFLYLKSHLRLVLCIFINHLSWYCGTTIKTTYYAYFTPICTKLTT